MTSTPSAPSVLRTVIVSPSGKQTMPPSALLSLLYESFRRPYGLQGPAAMSAPWSRPTSDTSVAVSAAASGPAASPASAAGSEPLQEIPVERMEKQASTPA